MKKILLLAFAATALFFTACSSSDDDNPTRDEQLKQRLIEVGTWKNVGYYYSEWQDGEQHISRQWRPFHHISEQHIYMFTPEVYTFRFYKTSEAIEYIDKHYSYIIKHDTLYTKDYSVFTNKGEVSFRNDTCFLTEVIRRNYTTKIIYNEYVLLPKNTIQ